MGIARVMASDDMIKSAVSPPITPGAAPGMDLKRMLLYMGIGGAIQPVVGGVVSGLGKIKDATTKRKTWKEIVKRYPDMNDEATKERFEAMFDMSPSVMKHITFAIPSLRSASEYGTEGIPVDLAGKLVSIDAQRTKGDPNLAQNIIAGASVGLGAAQKEQQSRQSAEQFAESQRTSGRTLAEKIREYEETYEQKDRFQRQNMLQKLFGQADSVDDARETLHDIES